MHKRNSALTLKTLIGKLSICLLTASICSVIHAKETLADEDPVIRLDTTKGPIFIRVFRAAVPNTAGNFLDLVSRGFYSGKIFHRIENWCIQGGDPNGNGSGAFIDPSTGQPRYIPLEINRNFRHSGPGVVAMARSSAPNSASCQFYISKCAMNQLDFKYAIFGRVVGGMDAVMAMRRGDQIQGAYIVQSGSSEQSQSGGQGSGQSGGQSGGQQQQRRRKNEPLVPYEPPSELPNSGF